MVRLDTNPSFAHPEDVFEDTLHTPTNLYSDEPPLLRSQGIGPNQLPNNQ